MADDKKLTNELLSDDELDNVAGGYHWGEDMPGDLVQSIMSFRYGVGFQINGDSPNTFTLNDRPISREDLFKYYQELYDKGAFQYVSGIDREHWNSWSNPPKRGDERTDINPACMSAAFINGEITGGEDF